MSDVAKQLGTRASTLYRHVNNKRELYFAMLTREYDLFRQRITEIMEQLQSPSPVVILKAIGSEILDMSRNNFERFSLMFLTKPPDLGSKADEIHVPGPFEKACDPQRLRWCSAGNSFSTA